MSEASMERMRYGMPPSWLPNQKGFRFIGSFFDADGRIVSREAEVTTRVLDSGTEIHTVVGYKSLVGWHYIPEKKA